MILLTTIKLFLFSATIPEVLGSQATFTESSTASPASRLCDQKSHNQCETRGLIPHWHFETETPRHRNTIAAYVKGLCTIHWRLNSYTKEEALISGLPFSCWCFVFREFILNQTVLDKHVLSSCHHRVIWKEAWLIFFAVGKLHHEQWKVLFLL